MHLFRPVLSLVLSGCLVGSVGRKGARIIRRKRPTAIVRNCNEHLGVVTIYASFGGINAKDP